jgi:hypothetical protein
MPEVNRFSERKHIILERAHASLFVQVDPFMHLPFRRVFTFLPRVGAKFCEPGSGHFYRRSGSPEHDGPVGHQGAPSRAERERESTKSRELR